DGVDRAGRRIDGEVRPLVDGVRLRQLDRSRPGLSAIEGTRKHDLRARRSREPTPDQIDIAGRESLRRAEWVEGAGRRAWARDVHGDPRLVDELAGGARIDDDGRDVFDRIESLSRVAVLLLVGVDQRRDKDTADVGAAVEGNTAVVEEAVRAGADSG